MMIRRFHESELNNQMDKIGTLFYLASNSLDIKNFINYFTISGISKKLDSSSPKYLYGKSSYDILNEVLGSVNIDCDIENNIPEKNKYYWLGYVLSYFHYYSNISYDEMLYKIDIDILLKAYNVYHEIDIKHAYDFIKMTFFNKTMLQILRDRNSLTQIELSKRSSVNIRNIQLYEQRQNDINKASTITLFNLSKVLKCNIEDLLEFHKIN